MAPVRGTGRPSAQPSSVGWKQATTFPGFCSKHDGPTFAPLEAVLFAGTAEQCFLLAYRSLCFELYQKRGALRAMPFTRQLLDRGLAPQEQAEVQDDMDAYAEASIAGLRDLGETKTELDKALLSQDWGAIESDIVSFRGAIEVVSSGAAAPSADLRGTPLQRYEDLDTRLEELYWNVVATDSGGAVVIGRRRNCPVMQRFVDDILRQGRAALPSIVVQLLFLFLENTYFSAEWWKALSAADRMLLRRLAAEIDASPAVIDQRRQGLIGWQITGTQSV